MIKKPERFSHRRPVRSFVLRGGRLTEGQQRALDKFWPEYGIEESAEAVDPQQLFGRRAPLMLEIGFGDGEVTWRMAAASPQEDFIAVEVHKPGVGRLLMRLEEAGIANVRIYCGDAVEFLEQRISPHALSGVRLFFPDPWPKKRHHKRRIVQSGFIDNLARRMKPGAILHLATDWLPYATHMLEVLAPRSDFENLSSTGDYCERPGWRPQTKYELRGRRLGHEVYDLLFRRTV